jgi:hypothetical protein
MELSSLSRYPVSEPFLFDDGEVLDLCWDANFFSRARLRAFDEALEKKVEEARKPHADRLDALQREVSALAEGQEKRKNKAPRADEETRLRDIAGEVEDAASALEKAVTDVTRDHYADALAREVLLTWGMTQGGQPVPITAEVLSAQPLLFLQDVMSHARQRSLPKSRRAATARLTMIPSPTNGTSSRPTTPAPESLST